MQADSLPAEPQDKPEYQGRNIQNRLLSCLGPEMPVHAAQRLQAKGCFPPGATQNVPKRLSNATSSWKPPLIAPLLGVPHSPMVTGFDNSFGNSSPPDSEPPRAGLAWGHCRNPWSQGSIWGAGHEAALGPRMFTGGSPDGGAVRRRGTVSCQPRRSWGAPTWASSVGPAPNKHSSLWKGTSSPLKWETKM